MKTNYLVNPGVKVVGAGLALALLAGCYNPDGSPNNTETGALTGGAFGAATGAIIGSASHSAGAGALIGAGAGALLGGLIGNGADQQQAAQAARLREEYPATYNRAVVGNPLSVADVTALSKAGLSDDTIIAQIVNSHTVFHLSATDIINLHDAGVSQKVIDYMINTQSTITPAATAVAVASAPPPAPVEVMTVSPGPGYVWTGGEWVWNGAGWYWSAGYWAYPPWPGAYWVAGYWGHGPHGGWVRYGGHWRR